MNYKLSNIATKDHIKDFTKLSFKYPYIYKPRLKINGFKEQTIIIITSDNPKIISQGIWGLLPQNYSENWSKFQKIKNTLHTNIKEIKNNILYKEALLKRRCLIIVTGFYTHKIIDNTIENYLVEKKHQQPFYLAGIYNITNDGFITCSVINTKNSKAIASFNNIYKLMPLQIPEIFKNMWLNNETPIEDINFLIEKTYKTVFKIQKIAS
ncbi:SOS response-associated peptidase family protein [Tenacibaculum aestuariivivum]|uniref:SOS response-associated peptidase family protein n=1 Tax=Tenacibaculum aestuariivivum TaxID=2006131 RepID=UPI003AB475ED